ncbi:uncharacterized protein LOC116846822 isoform X2 [Odontomachus brunneus]|uniref:uncharacterized protein LOC116846822 isoform X2 n=1 Tax=Odontomachus brunneus TaxID=486640 RepID=UPI0013F24F1D|nr:uncharacterized protein LOC116846822 isoform X2 [Odontomachus brunneus]
MQSEAIRVVSNLCEGRRVVELKELGKNLKCCQCKEVLCLERITNKRRFDLHSSLSILCDKCDVLTLVAAEKMHSAVDNKTFKNHADVNIKAVLGAVHTGIGSFE